MTNSRASTAAAVRRTLLASLTGLTLAGLAPLAAGCRPTDPAAVRSGEVSNPGADTHRDAVDVRPEWRAFALENYRGTLLADLNAARDARFLEPPRVIASRNRATGDVELSVAGEVDANTVTGERFRRPFLVLWRQAPGGWQLLMSRVDTGGPTPSPSPLAGTPGPIRTSPSTAPSTIADPTAAPPPSNNPSGLPTPSPAAVPPGLPR